MSGTSENENISITIEFRYVHVSCSSPLSLTPRSGGLEILFANQKKYSLSLPTKDDSGAPANVAFLVRYLCENVMKDPRKELFVLDGTV